MKNPTVLDGNFVPLGLIEILLSPPSSDLTSIASSNSLSLTKQSLHELKICVDSPTKALTYDLLRSL